jgi:pimeloyl-ACP methyl ester carboxylesterase
VLQLPTLMIWGERDVALGKELTYGTERYVADLTVRYIPDAGHWVQQERPREVNRYMAEFLRRVGA